MNDQALRTELDRVSGRYRRLLFRLAFAVCWLMLAVAGVAVLLWAQGTGYAVPGLVVLGLALVPLLFLPVLLAWLKRVKDPLWVAHKIEKKFPDLDTRLLAAMEQREAGDKEGLGFLQQTVIDEAVTHARTRGWENVVPKGRLRLAQLVQVAMLGLFAAVMVGLIMDLKNRPGEGGFFKGGVAKAVPFDIHIDPEDSTIERGTSLVVTARFGTKRLPADVQLLYRDADGDKEPVRMNKSLDDPLFAGRVAPVEKDLSYAVRYGDAQTKWYKVTVFDYPALQQADAALKFPEYTGQPEKKVEDTRSVTAVEGTTATLTFHLNKPVAQAQLVPTKRPGEKEEPTSPPVALVPDAKDPTLYTATMEMKESRSFRLSLVDAEKRTNKDASSFALNVTPNKPPELKMVTPGHDVDVSPLEELTVRAQVSDDFGVKRVGMTYSIGDQPEKEVVLAENLPGKEKKDVAQVLSMETLGAQPDQLLSYHLWAEDVGPDGKPRRTEGDIFFGEVRPFEMVYRQGQQPAGGEEQQQQQRQQQGQQNAQQAQQQSENEKQIIAATWKVIRRETGEKLTDTFVPDVKVIEDAQTKAKEQAASLGERLQDPKSQGILEDVLKSMDSAAAQLKEAQGGEGGAAPSVKPLTGALASEQGAYQGLLKLRAREVEVIRSNRQRGQQQGQSSAQARQQQQLDQLDMQDEQNRYETQRNAQNQQAQEQQQREDRQVSSRLRELAQRQEALNRQMQELQAALQKARDQQQREELQRQLARLRDQQEQQLRDTDELRDRMDQPQNQERMADNRQQLDNARNNVERANEQLQQGQLADAAAAGQRASEQLNNLRDDMRRNQAGQFNEAMTQMRDDARALEQKEQELSQQLANLDQAATQPAPAGGGLRDQGQQERQEHRQQLATDLQQQKKDLEKLLENMRQTVEQADATEPLLSRQLYDTIRQTRQERTPEAIDTTRQMVQQGLLPQARQTETDAGRGLTRLRQGVEQAAQSVLGDDTAALQRARIELTSLGQQMQNEAAGRGGQNGAATQRALAGGAGGAATQPGGTTQPALAAGGNATQPGMAGGATTQRALAGGVQGAAGTRPAGQMGGQVAQNGGRAGNPQNGQNQQNGRGGNSPDGGERQLAQGPGMQQGGQAGVQNDRTNQNGQAGAAGQDGQERQLAGGQAGQRNGEGAATQPGERQVAGGQQGGEQNGQQGRGQQGAQGGERNQQGQQGGQQGGQQTAQGQQEGGQQAGGQQGRGQQPGGEQQANQAGGQRGGQQGGQRGGQQVAQGGQRGNPQGGQRGQQPGAQSGQGGEQQANGQQPEQGQQGQAGQGQEGQQANAGQGGQRGQQPGQQGGQQANGRGGQRGARGGQQGGQLANGQQAATQPGDQAGDQQANAQDQQQQGEQQANAQEGQQPGQQGQQGRGGQGRGNRGQQANAGRGGERGGQPGQRGQGGQPQEGQPQDGQNPQEPEVADAQGQQPGEQPGQQGQQGQQPGQGQGQGQGQQPGQQPGQQAGRGTGRGGQRGTARGNQPGQAGQGQPGQTGQQPGENPQLAQNDQQAPGQNPQAAGRGGGGNTMRGGNQPTPVGPQQQRPDGPQLAQENTDPTRPGAEQRAPGTMPSVRTFAGGGYGGPDPRNPLTGEGFKDWSDRMRDVEELVNDPKMRAAAAAIRERAAAMRAEFKKQGTEPNWTAVQETINKPLFELRDQVAQELMKRQSTQALVPIDREPVPPQYADEVRRYYERLGSGK